ncbi:hypothetical protein [Bacillus clarus]|uniref:Uncharacterized protein n=1 Tax=Bacillus clarus TaxID=2338372 RepID=A0A090YZ76_9BACI|nr:hypothetical protein [Bacillus clarus]KFN04284.1 hypothetical protein DJ93_4933 [Bacillus clarus]
MENNILKISLCVIFHKEHNYMSKIKKENMGKNENCLVYILFWQRFLLD